MTALLSTDWRPDLADPSLPVAVIVVSPRRSFAHRIVGDTRAQLLDLGCEVTVRAGDVRVMTAGAARLDHNAIFCTGCSGGQP